MKCCRSGLICTRFFTICTRYFAYDVPERKEQDMEQKRLLPLLCHIFCPRREKNFPFLSQSRDSKESKRGDEKTFLFFALSDFSSQRREKLSLCLVGGDRNPIRHCL